MNTLFAIMTFLFFLSLFFFDSVFSFASSSESIVPLVCSRVQLYFHVKPYTKHQSINAH